MIVSSTDKNFMVPVGGSLIYSQDVKLVQSISKNYPGRASMSPLLDLFITLLEMGKSNWRRLVKERKSLFEELKTNIALISAAFSEKVIENKRNKISIAMTLTTVFEGKSKKECTFLGSKFFKKQVSGVKIIAPSEETEFCGVKFKNYGCHADSYDLVPACIFAAAIGISKEDVNKFCKKLVEALNEVTGKKIKVDLPVFRPNLKVSTEINISI